MLAFPPLALALCGLESLYPANDQGLLAAAPWVRSIGFRALQLNGAAVGLRARDLTRTARKDVAAVLKRTGLELSGIDLWIPPEHFADPAHADRAAAAVVAAIELAADLRRFVMQDHPVSVDVILGRPGSPPPDRELLSAIETQADRCNVRIADHALPRTQAAGGATISPLGIGLDPAAVLLTGGDPIKEATTLGSRLAAARLSDARAGVRVSITDDGRGGGLDLQHYAVALHSSGFAGHVVADVRALADPGAGARAAAETWKVQTPP